MQQQDLQSIILLWGKNSPLQTKTMTVGLMVIKNYLQKVLKFYLFHLYLFFHKETALNYTLEAGGSMIVVLVTSMVSSRMITMTSILLLLHKMRKKYPFGEKRKLESPSWLFGPHSPTFQFELIIDYNYYFLLQQLLDSQFNI